MIFFLGAKCNYLDSPSPNINEINRSQKIMYSISFLAHAPELHVPSKNYNSNPEVQQVESNSVNKKSKNEMPQISSPKVEIPVKTITDKKVINVLDLAQVNTFIPQPGEIVFLLLLVVPFLLFSMKRYLFR